MSEKIYPQGITCFAPKSGAPDFVLGSGVFTIDDLIEWFNNNRHLETQYNGKRQIRFNLIKNRDGRPSLSVDTWKKDEPAQDNNFADPPQDNLPF